MTDIRTAVSKLNRGALGGAKIPHSVSNPVLRREKDTLYLAAFVYTYSRDNLAQNKMPRPIRWMLADIGTGDVVREIDCRESDFSREPFGGLYDLSDPTVLRPSREDFAEIYGMIDQVRTQYLDSGQLDNRLYQRYLDRILAVTPASYRVFYRELSNLDKGAKP